MSLRETYDRKLQTDLVSDEEATGESDRKGEKLKGATGETGDRWQNFKERQENQKGNQKEIKQEDTLSD